MSCSSEADPAPAVPAAPAPPGPAPAPTADNKPSPAAGGSGVPGAPPSAAGGAARGAEGGAAAGRGPAPVSAAAPPEGAMSNGVYVPPGAANGEVKPVVSGTPLVDFLLQLEDYTPTVRAARGGRCGRAGTDIRLISLAAQKFISDIANDALQHCKMKGTASGSSRNKSKDKKYTLTMEDLTPALAEYGINVKKPHYFT
uniref:TATA-box binding protein associated factor 10 n=1 Tax=Phasianus colchicus TaxID=9054 RepID=A0A669QRW6_PHACC